MLTDGKGNYFQRQIAGPWRGLVPVEVPKVEDARHRWGGGKISLDLVRQMNAFFEWSLKETGGETVCHLFYNEDSEEWAALVLPQKGHTGMSVTMLPDDPRTVAAVESLGPGWCECGTIHHHCGMSAFQSGTDKKDEEDRAGGLHVTMGGIGTGRYSFDARCRTHQSKHFTPAVLSDWIALPERYADLPEAVQDFALAHLLAEPHPDYPFPEGWKANVVKVAPVVVTGQTYGNYMPPWQKKEWPSQNPQAGQAYHWKSYRTDLRELAIMCDMEPAEFLSLAKELLDDTIAEALIDVMVDHKLDKEEVLEFFEKEAAEATPLDPRDKDFDDWKQAWAD